MIRQFGYLILWRLFQIFSDAVAGEQERLVARLVETTAGKLGMRNLTDPQWQELIEGTEKLHHFYGA